jgi:hypothetical protein
VGLVRGAKALEKDANEEALRYVSHLLLRREVGQMGSAPATLIPIIFEKVFGTSPFSVKFVFRSIISTILFWVILLIARHADINKVLLGIYSPVFSITVLTWFIIDWVSLTKSKFLLNLISTRYAVISSLIFFMADLILSYSLLLLFMVPYLFFSYKYFGIYQSLLEAVDRSFSEWLRLGSISRYFISPSESVTLSYVLVPATMLTAIWTFFLFLSSIIVQLIAPIDYLRRFTAWWFRDVERHPLTAVAKVTATLVIIGAVAIKVARLV